jgi:hypothetical protein
MSSALKDIKGSLEKAADILSVLTDIVGANAVLVREMGDETTAQYPFDGQEIAEVGATLEFVKNDICETRRLVILTLTIIRGEEKRKLTCIPGGMGKAW